MSSDESPIYIPPAFICVICQEVLWKESVDNKIVSAPCGHVYHQSCIFDWLVSQSNVLRCQGECPTCYKGINFSQCHKIFLSVDDDDSLLTQLRVCEEVRKDNMNLRKELEDVRKETTHLKRLIDDANARQAKRVSPTTLGILTPATTPAPLPAKGKTTATAGTSRKGISSAKTTTPALNRKAAPKRLTAAVSTSSTSSISVASASASSPRVVAATGMKLRPRVKADKAGQGTGGKITATIAKPVDKGRKGTPTPALGRVASSRTGR